MEEKKMEYANMRLVWVVIYMSTLSKKL